MKSLNNELWNDINVEEFEAREEFAVACFACFIGNRCFKCVSCFKCIAIL